MESTPDIAPTDPDIPSSPPPAEEGIEIPDQPLGVPQDADPDEAPLPGVPEQEPPAAD